MSKEHSRFSRRTVLKAGSILATGGVAATGFGSAQQHYLLEIEQYPEEEYVVITNVGDGDADITGYSINFEAEDDDYNQIRELAGEVVIAAGESITVPTGAREVEADNIVELDDPYDGEVLNNDGSDIVVLLDTEDNTVATTGADGPAREFYTVTYNIELLDNVPDDIEIPPLEVDIGRPGEILGDWVYDGSTLNLQAGTYNFRGTIYPYPDEQIASNFYIAELPGVIELDSDREVTYVFGYDAPNDSEDDPGDDSEDNTDDGEDPDGTEDTTDDTDKKDDADDETHDGSQSDGSAADTPSDESGGSDGKDCPSH